MPLLNYTTKIDVEKTLGEIQKMLGRAGAMKIMTDYEDGVVSVMSFALNVNGQTIGFRLPCDLSEMRLQSVRTAWRIVKDWVEAQLALVETTMVKTEQVFLPYMVVKGGQTLFQQVEKNQFMLGDGK